MLDSPISPRSSSRVVRDASVTASNFEGWSEELRAEFAGAGSNYQVGGKLLSETNKVKVWEIRLAPGERLPAHKHVLDYFWTVLTAGESEQHSEDGATRRVSYEAGTTRHFAFGPGEYLLHDLKNVGPTELVFISVEHQRDPDDPGPRQL
jgi:hypothetical protein